MNILQPSFRAISSEASGPTTRSCRPPVKQDNLILLCKQAVGPGQRHGRAPDPAGAQALDHDQWLCPLAKGDGIRRQAVNADFLFPCVADHGCPPLAGPIGLLQYIRFVQNVLRRIQETPGQTARAPGYSVCLSLNTPEAGSGSTRPSPPRWSSCTCTSCRPSRRRAPWARAAPS